MKRIFTLTLIVLSLPSYSQHVIHTERPGEVQSPKTAGKHVFQMELGYLKEKHHEGYSEKLPEMLFRYGPNNWLELRLNLTVETQDLPAESIFRDGFRPIEPGVQIAFLKDPKNIQLAFQGHLGLPVISSGKHDPGKVYHRLRVLGEAKMTEHFSVSGNVARDWDYKKHHQNWMYGFAPEVEITERVKLMSEVYGFFSKGHHPESMLAAGISYAFHNNISADINGGIGLNEASPKHFFGFGIAFRVH
jgi:hypothetical protein